MSTPKQKLLITPEQYLAFEREADERHEWLDGVIRQMAGESPQHSIICSNVNASFNLQLRGKPCATFSPNMKVYSRLATDTAMKGLFSYTDTLIVCGPPQFHDQHGDVLTNPKVIVEVLSDSTEKYDRSEKFERYAQNSSLTDYILISQHRACVEHFARQEQGVWQYYRATTLTDIIHLASIDCHLPLVEVYDRIEFKTAAQEVEVDETQD
jgi:Uma2 family endonuclease